MSYPTHRTSIRPACLVVILALMAGCASHRAPPTCKGPFTPINSPVTAATHDPQR